MQAAVERRFAGLDPGSLPQGVKVICVANVRPPRELHGLWANVTSARFEEAMSEDSLDATSLCVLVCDVFDRAQVAQASHVMDRFLEQDEPPPVLLLPALDMPGNSVYAALRQTGLLGKCIDDVITGGPSGGALALAIGVGLAKLQRRDARWDHRYHARCTHAERFHDLQQGMDNMIWQNVRLRLHVPLPPVDYNLGDNIQRGFAGYTIGDRLWFGADELVFRIQPPAGAAVLPCGEMVKVLAKSGVQRTVEGVRRVHRTWQILHSLSTTWKHPNIVRSLGLYHGPTNFYIRMELAGTESLYRRLRDRAAGTAALSSAQLRSLVVGLMDVVHHLHTGPQVCHRDIKPENIAITEPGDSDTLHFKLVNFDTSAAQRRHGVCKLKAGTFPFVAPEVAEPRYDGMAADMWSLGIVLLEISCGAGIVERSVLEIAEGKVDYLLKYSDFPRREVRRVCDKFADSECIRQLFLDNKVPELDGFDVWYFSALQGVLQLCPLRRWTAACLLSSWVTGSTAQASKDACQDCDSGDGTLSIGALSA